VKAGTLSVQGRHKFDHRAPGLLGVPGETPFPCCGKQCSDTIVVKGVIGRFLSESPNGSKNKDELDPVEPSVLR